MLAIGTFLLGLLGITMFFSAEIKDPKGEYLFFRYFGALLTIGAFGLYCFWIIKGVI